MLTRSPTKVSQGTALAALCALFALPATSVAETTSFRYFSVQYQELENDQGADFDGINLAVSGRIKPNWFLSANYAQMTADRDTGPGNFDWDIAYGRLGYILHEDNVMALYAGPQVHYVSYDILHTSGNDSETGYGAFAGARYMLSQKLEASAEISYSNLPHNGQSQFLQYQLGGRYFINNRFAVEASGQFGDWPGFTIGGSVHF